MNKIWAISFFFLFNCATTNQKRELMLNRASFDLDCPKESIKSQMLGIDSWGVNACGKKAVYLIDCYKPEARSIPSILDCKAVLNSSIAETTTAGAIYKGQNITVGATTHLWKNETNKQSLVLDMSIKKTLNTDGYIHVSTTCLPYKNGKPDQWHVITGSTNEGKIEYYGMDDVYNRKEKTSFLTDQSICNLVISESQFTEEDFNKIFELKIKEGKTELNNKTFYVLCFNVKENVITDGICKDK